MNNQKVEVRPPPPDPGRPEPTFSPFATVSFALYVSGLVAFVLLALILT